jgi:predicted secreted hydrolase
MVFTMVQRTFCFYLGLLWLILGIGIQPGYGRILDRSGTTVTWFDSGSRASNQNFAHAIEPRTWQLPQDFGPHPAYQTEWWYYTGNLETAEGRPFGFQLTFFRQGLEPEDLRPTSASPIAASPIAASPITASPIAASPIQATTPISSPIISSPWRTPQLYSAHFTLSDIANQEFHFEERFSRGAAGLAGAKTEPYQVWLQDWSAIEINTPDSGFALGPVRLQAETPDMAIDLTLTQTLAPIFHGDRGLSQKGEQLGNASYYYSLVQQSTRGEIRLGDRTYPVQGITWKDHEYGTYPQNSTMLGWDWFSAAFDNGSALMLYQLRQEDGVAKTSSGTLILADGTLVPLHWQDWQLDILNTWQSPQTYAIYPAQWRLQIPRLDLTLIASPLIASQELRTSTASYWEGAVNFAGTYQGQALQGKGYVELTGYADRLNSVLAGQS